MKGIQYLSYLKNANNVKVVWMSNNVGKTCQQEKIAPIPVVAKSGSFIKEQTRRWRRKSEC